MKAINKIIISAILSGALIFSNISANAAATQADVDYSTQVSQTVQTFSTDAADWAAVVGSAPTLAAGSKFKEYKVKASKSSDKFLATIKKLKSLKASPGFSKSGPMLVSAMGLYEKAITALKAAINKNDAKAIGKAGQVAVKANSAFLAWQKSYSTDVAALNG
ncbi:MAG: hypothetical protein RL301_150 [Actinomycetota bacterium]